MADPLTIGLMAAGTVLSTVGQISAGRAADSAAKFEARQMEQQAKAEQARASALAAEEHRQKRIALSRAQAVGAASGGGRDFRLEGDLEREGTYRAMTALWEGEERASGRRMQAAATRAEGKAARRAGFISGVSTLIGGAGRAMGSNAGQSLLEKYG